MECVFESDFEKGFLCNGSRFYKNVQSVCLLKMFQYESVGV